MTETINPRRLAEVMGRELGAGSHGRWEDGVCVVEAAAFVAGEPWSDRPECVSPVLAAFLRAWNDALDDATRQRLRPYVARIVGTDDGRDERRAWLALDWLVRVQAPAWMGLTDGLRAHGEALAGLEPQTSTAALASEAPRAAAWGAARAAAWGAARAAAWGAARGAAWGAAWDAAWAAAGSVAGGAARDAVGGAVGDAAQNAAWAAAWAAAQDAGATAQTRTAARDALAPTRDRLIESAFVLLDRMIEADPEDRPWPVP